jgi:hypothetical protein
MDDDDIIMASVSGSASTDDGPARDASGDVSLGEHRPGSNNFSGVALCDASTGNTPTRSTPTGFPAGDTFGGGYTLDANKADDSPTRGDNTGASRNDSLASSGYPPKDYTGSNLQENPSQGNSDGSSPSGKPLPNAVVARALKIVADSRRKSSPCVKLQGGSGTHVNTASGDTTTDYEALNYLIELSTCEKLKTHIIGESARSYDGRRT